MPAASPMTNGIPSPTEAGFSRLRESTTPQESPAEAVNYRNMRDQLRKLFDQGTTKDLTWRKFQLNQVKKMIEENHEEITETVRMDHGGPKIRGLVELGAHSAADLALTNIDAWTAQAQVSTPFNVAPSMMAKSFVRQEPKGVVLIIAPWNFPIELALHPLVSAIAAGNCVVIKPSEVSKHSAALIERLCDRYLDRNCIKVVQGAVAETQALLREKWDHIFYTGNGDIARHVLRAAAENLTPVTLELGGKSPVVIDKSAKIDTAVKRVTYAKWLNAGQICVAPDYVLVHREKEQEFIQGMLKEIEKQYGEDPKQSKDFGRIINEAHAKRISGLLEKTQGQVLGKGADAIDVENRYVPPTLVQGAAMGEPLMTEEIFGPVLPVITVNSMEDAVSKIKEVCDTPLALYIYSQDKKATATVLDGVTSGGACINDSLNHLMNTNMPFGGTGASGYGAYHGKAGFDEFSHRRSVLHQDTFLKKGAALPPAPYQDKLYDMGIRMAVTGWLSPMQKRAIKIGALVAAGGVYLKVAKGNPGAAQMLMMVAMFGYPMLMSRL